MHNAGAQHVIVRYYSNRVATSLARAVSLSHLRVSDWRAEGFSGKDQVTQAADQPFPKPLSTDLCKTIPNSQARGGTSSIFGCTPGPRSTKPHLRGNICNQKPSQRNRETVCRGTNTSKSRRAYRRTTAHHGEDAPAKGSAFMMPHAALDRSPSLSSAGAGFVCKPSAWRPAALRGPRWTDSLIIL